MADLGSRLHKCANCGFILGAGTAAKVPEPPSPPTKGADRKLVTTASFAAGLCLLLGIGFVGIHATLGLVYAFLSGILWCAIPLAAISAIARKIAGQFRVVSRVGVGFIVGALICALILSGNIFLRGVSLGAIVLSISAGFIAWALYSGSLWLTDRLALANRVYMPVFVLSVAVSLINVIADASTSPWREERRGEVGELHRSAYLSMFEKEALGIMKEHAAGDSSSELPNDWEQLIIGNYASLTIMEQLKFARHHQVLHAAAVKAVAEIELRRGRTVLMDLLIESYKQKKNVSFLETAGMDVVGRVEFYAALRSSMHQ